MAATEIETAAGIDAREETAYTLGVQAMLWGYPFVCYARTTEAAVRVGASRVNAFTLHTELKTAADRYVVTPNNVTLDGYAALDLREGPVVVHVPALVEPRWYIVQIGDMFDEIVANVGGTKGPRAGAYAITGPDFRGELPGELTRVPVRTQWAVCGLRVFVDGQADVPAAVDVQRGFHVMPLQAYLRDGLSDASAPGVKAPALSEDGPENVRFFDQLGQAMRWFLPVSSDVADPLVAAFHQIGLSVARGFDAAALNTATIRGLARAAQAGEQIIDARWAEVGDTVDGWRYTMSGGRSGHELALRAALVKNVLGANLASEIVYPNCAVDADGEALNGAHDYELRFAPGGQPPASVLWNLAMYGDDMLFIENDAGRYTIGSTTDGLLEDADGGLTLYIQHRRPSDERQAANWLPAPDGPFNLTMRFYGASTAVLDGTYRLPAVARRS